MTPSPRPECPAFLSENWEEWGKQYAKNRADNKAYRFNWKWYQGKPVNLHLMRPLTEMTDGHYAYCDWFPMDCGAESTIDHFKPKARFPLEAYHWPNLYLACGHCQRKLDGDLSEAAFEQLIRPDEPGYAFEKFFIYNYRDGTISPLPSADTGNLKRAELTIKVFRLNADGRPTARQREWQLKLRNSDMVLSERPFRYLFSE